MKKSVANTFSKLILVDSRLFKLSPFVFGIFATIYSTFLNVDVYHEGDKFPSAVVLAHGGMIFRDVNNIYGFLPSLLVAPFVNLFGSHLIVSRLVGLIIKLVLVLVFVKTLGRFISTINSLSLAGVWLLITPAWANIRDPRFSNAFAWPTHYGLVLIFLAVIFFPNDLRNSWKSYGQIFLSSFLLAVSWSARLEFIATWIMWTIALLFLLRKKVLPGKLFLAWISGASLFFAGTFLWLYKNHALTDWFKQTIVVWISNPPAQPQITPAWILMNAVSFLTIGALGLLVFSIFYSIGCERIHSYFISLALIIGFIFVGPHVRNFKFVSFNIGAWMYEISNRGLLSYVNIIFAVGLALSGIFIYNYFFKKNSRDVPIYILLLAISNFSLLSMLHIVNADYIQMFVMPFGVVVFWHLKSFTFSDSMKYQKHLLASVATVLTFSILACVGFSQTFFHSTYAYRSPVLKGLYDQDLISREAIDNRMNTVARFSSKGIWTFCISGLPSIATGQYESKDQWLWNLEPEPWMVERWSKVKADDYLYVCSLLPREQIIFDRNLRNGKLRIVDSGAGFEIYQATGSLS